MKYNCFAVLGMSLIIFGVFVPRSYAQVCHTELTKVVAPDGVPGAQLGFAVDVSGDAAVLGAMGDSDNGTGSGSAYVYRYNGTDWVFEAKLTASDGEPGDMFGWSVAIYGNIIAIGACSVDSAGLNAGAVYIYEFNGTHWVERAKLYASNPMPEDVFGWSVDLSASALFVGAIGVDSMGVDSGMVYVFDHVGSLWTQREKLSAFDGESGDSFGYCVSVSGEYAVIGVPHDSDNGDNSGSIYIYQYDGANWGLDGKLLAVDGVEAQQYGRSVAIAGTTVAVGAVYGAYNNTNLGSVYIYEHNGFVWAQQAKLVTPDANGYSRFGEFVAISPNASTVAVGAHGTSPSQTGAAYVYALSDAGWTQQASLLASDGQTNDHFGFKVGVSDSAVLISSPSVSSSMGAGYFYDLNQAPCPADLSGDCVLNFFDVSAFLQAFGNNDPIADFSGDGLFNFFDVSAFLQAFSAGCP